MKVDSETSDTEVEDHCANEPHRCGDEEEFGGSYHDNNGYDLQERLYQFLLGNPQIDTTRSYATTNRTPDHSDQSSVEGTSSETMSAALQLAMDEALAKELQEAETLTAALELVSDEVLAEELQEAENELASASISQIAAETMSADLQLATDEALAKELQEADNELAGTSTSQIEDGTTSAGSSPGNMSPTSSTTSAQVATQDDDVDPDNMTYEELNAMGESLGAESRGLSDAQISLLPSTTYKIGFFSRKRKDEECVICCMTYKNRDKLLVLPCLHRYHESCAARWLKINKACPVCKKDVCCS